MPTLKNQAPDFFHISRCSAQILHSQIMVPSPWSADPEELELPNNAVLINEVIDEDIDDEEVKDEWRC